MNLLKNCFPYVWKNSENNSLSEVIQKDVNEILNILSSNGAILFKGFNIDTLDNFESCINAYPYGTLNYLDGNSPRTKLNSKVYTSTEYPSNAFISLHNELSYTNNWPSYLFFCCITPADSGGNTLLADSREIYKNLSDDLLKMFESKNITYIRNLHGGEGLGKSWQNTFETDDRKVIEKYCKENHIKFSWVNDTLRITHTSQAVIQHPKTGDKVWFNQADQFHPSTNTPEVFNALMEMYDGNEFSMPHYSCFGDNSEIPLEMLTEIRDVTDQQVVSFEWERGDLMIVDNVLIAHGRSPFEGDRKILVSMTE